ncbi:MAG: extracellular solute-binding protein [Acetobacteraceae bacterium]|nr:extracellular solute-binding protein [Acetobacteraceae bacterium]
MQRRTLMRTAAALPLVSLLRPATARAEVKEIRMIEAGGKSGESIEKGYGDPFTAKTGIKLVRESPAPLGKLRAMVESGKITATLFELGSGTMVHAKSLGLIEKLDWAAINPNPMFPEARNEYGFGYQYYSTGMAWQKGTKPLRSWADFFNTKDFPGKRAIPDYVGSAVPFALLADGVPVDKLFPLDIDRALKKLLSIRKDISVVWKAGAQAPQLLNDGEVQYAIAWSGRIVEEPKLVFNFNGAMADLAFICMIKGSPKEEQAAAAKLYHEMSVAKNQARAAEVVAYTGPSPDLDALLPKDKLFMYPTAKVNKDVQWVQNAEYWAEHGEEGNKKWETFKLSL